ncbi:MAG: c-type cytochrome, partial [Fidelibacterota bacterium]
EVEYWNKPLLTGQAAQATCSKCHQNFKKLRGASLLSRGEELLEKYACYGCHKIAGYKNMPKTGPPLSYIGEKVNYTWLVKWIKNPEEVMPGARMPDFGFSEEESKAVADYLYSLSRNDREDDPMKQIDWDLYSEGKVIYSKSRCSICHAVNGRGGAFKKLYAPDLGKEGSKVKEQWLIEWLRDPKHYYPGTRMPRYRFTDHQISALSEYIFGEFIDWDLEEQKIQHAVTIENSSISRGAELIKNYGCFGCHDIKGMEEMEKIGPYLRRSELEEMVGAELSSIGSKPLERLDFGRLKGIQKTRENFVVTKLKSPRVFRDGLKMPDFNFSDDEINALTTLLMGFTPREIENMPLRFRVPATTSTYEPVGEFGKIVDDLKCLTCHSINGKGGDFAPDLSIEGSKVKREWLVNFLKSPDIIRPLLKQMPQFNMNTEPVMMEGKLSLGEVEVIVDYIENVLISEDIPDKFLEGETVDEKGILEGKELYLKKGCNFCHQIGLEGGVVGPDLTEVGDRLKPAYIFMHLKDPRAFNPDIIEPDYNLSDDEALTLTKFLISLKKKVK